MANSYKFGSSVKVTALWSVSSVNTDPTVVTLYFRDPKGVETSHVYGVDANVVKSAVGSYYYIKRCAVSGKWVYRWEGTGTAPAEDENYFNILPSEIISG